MSRMRLEDIIESTRAADLSLIGASGGKSIRT